MSDANYICYGCAANIVTVDGGPPLQKIWGPNATPHKEGACAICSNSETLCCYPVHLRPARKQEEKIPPIRNPPNAMEQRVLAMLSHHKRFFEARGWRTEAMTLEQCQEEALGKLEEYADPKPTTEITV